MTESYEIKKYKTEKGFGFAFHQDNLVKQITCAGNGELLTVKDDKMADYLRQSIEKNALWFDEDDNMVISSPLYFLLSVEQTGVDWLYEQIENWPIFWSSDPFFHRQHSTLPEAEPLVKFLKSLNISPEALKDASYENWEDLEESHFLSETATETLTGHLKSLKGKKLLAALYFAFNSPHIVAGLAWVNGFYKKDEDFVAYTMKAEDFVARDKEQTAEFHYRLEQIAELRLYAGKELS